MNMNRLINMAMRMLMRKGINKGVSMMAAKGKRPEDMTPQERAQAQKARQNAGSAQKALRIGRRFMR